MNCIFNKNSIAVEKSLKNCRSPRAAKLASRLVGGFARNNTVYFTVHVAEAK